MMPVAVQVDWYFDALARLHDGKHISPDEIRAHVVPDLSLELSAERIASIEVEFERSWVMSVVTRRTDGRRDRREFAVEDIPPHRICGQLVTGPLPASGYSDQLVRDVLVRTYQDGGPDQLLLLHGAGAHVGCWDLVVPHLATAATVRAIDLRGHGRSVPRHRYSTQGCLEDIAASQGSVDLILVGHSLGGHVALEYAARNGCRALITLDGPAGLWLNATDEALATSPEPYKSVLADVNTQDVGRLISELTAPALFVVCHGSGWTKEQVGARKDLAQHASQHGHQGPLDRDGRPQLRLAGAWADRSDRQ